MKPVQLSSETLKWLLDTNDHALRTKVFADLLDRPEKDKELADARSKIPESPWVAATLDAIKTGRVWEVGFYQKYRGISWVMAHLSEMDAPPDHPAMQMGIDHFQSSNSVAHRIWGNDVGPLHGHQPIYWMHPIACLTARVATVLVRCEHLDHELVHGARVTIMHQYRKGIGFNCLPLEQSLLPGCIMTLPEVLKFLLILPKKSRYPEENEIIEDAISVLKSFNLYHYVPVRQKEFAKAIEGKKRDQISELKEQWISKGRLKERKEKAGWLKFSFPHNYNTDMLEVMRVLALADVKRDNVIDHGLDTILDQREDDGRWKMVGGQNGKMWADIDQKGKPSRWITYRALSVFKSFNLLEVSG